MVTGEVPAPNGHPGTVAPMDPLNSDTSTPPMRGGDRLASVVTFAMFAAAALYAVVVSALASGGAAAMQAWPVPGAPSDVAGWRLSGAAVSAAADEEGWLVVASAEGAVAPVGAPVRATVAGLRIDASLVGFGVRPAGELPVFECFTDPRTGEGLQLRFGDGQVRLIGPRYDRSEPFGGASGDAVEAVVSCALTGDEATVTVSGPDADLDRVEFVVPAQLSAGRSTLRLAGPTAVLFDTLEMSAARD